MKIRTKLTLRYLTVTAAVFSLLLLLVYRYSEKTREKEFYRDLTREAVTKANLFLTGGVDAPTMQSIYLNNREFIDEVEVAIYDTDFGLVYHDALQIDIVKETPELIAQAVAENEVRFYEGKYQAVALLYEYGGIQYVITAAAYDGYGMATVGTLGKLLGILWVAAMIILSIVGYYLSKSALSPVSRIVDDVGSITDRSLDKRLPDSGSRDELGELTATFNSMLDRLQKSFDSQKMFVSNVSHELRTPLAALIAELEVLLLKERTVGEYAEAAGLCLADARKIERLSAGLLDMARANYDPDRISRRDVRLDELVIDATETVMKANSLYNIDILFDQEIEDEDFITVSANEYLLKTAFVNLIENNCKFSEDKSSYIRISYYDNKAVVTFSDKGIGIGKEEAERIFDPFYRGSNTADVTGHGIGMALVKRIVELHKGTVFVRSELDQGTSFVCELPHLG